MLERILKAFCCVEGTPGYFQGMNDLGSVAIRVMAGDEARAFMCFEGLIGQMTFFNQEFPTGIWDMFERVAAVLRKCDPELLDSLMQCTTNSTQWVWLLPAAMLFLVREASTLEDTSRLWESSWVAECGASEFQVLALTALLGLHKPQLIALSELHELVQYSNSIRGTVETLAVVARAQALLKTVGMKLAIEHS
eukprot:TRINITY_DN50536_c0_g1_i2.p1 TRINITY_DN50536_c0_g1~~TRINITY_DN50536_c0_g1_i2.p1  ORF type:complete len:194 (-),score=38.86 TRINITY_DN50536_c0_g1_i2:67-648(-)